MRLYHYTAHRDYKCPKCNHLLRRESEDYGGNDGCYVFLMYIALLPVWLIIWGVKFLVKRHHKKNMIINSRGEEVVRCRKCKSYVAFAINHPYYYPDFDVVLSTNGTRLISEKEISELKFMNKNSKNSF